MVSNLDIPNAKSIICSLSNLEIMSRPVLTIFYQFNPWQSSIGGIQTIIRSFIKYAPERFAIRLVGTGHPNAKLGVWQDAEFSGRKLEFMPIIGIENDDVRRLIPTTIEYAKALIGKNLSSDFMHFHRIEPSLLARNWSGEKTLFIHNDIQKQMDAGNNQNAILWKRFPAAYFALEKMAITQFEELYICNTESVNFYRQLYPQLAERFTYLKNTVDNEIFYPVSKQEKTTLRHQLAAELGLPEATRFILFAGRLHPQKDPLLLIRALATIANPNIHLLMAGNGELADAIRAEINTLGLSKRVTMLGGVAQTQLANLYRSSSVFVLSSVYEGLSVAGLEALSSGTPVVTTDCGETPKFLNERSGIVCQQRTATALGEALNRVITMPEAYPVEACIKTVAPYIAKNVVESIYDVMWQRWEQRQKNVHSPQKYIHLA
jgi:glycosyltransferase involved in cell wall biosynthesis